LIRVETDLEGGREAGTRGDVVIVVDVLRFSSSVVVGLACGADAFIPVRTLAEARKLGKRNRRLILAGERNGVKPRGFHLGNSPTEFENANLKGKTIVITTTNGTAALESSRGARWLLVGSFINARAVSTAASRLSEDGNGISIILASRPGCIFLEDFLCTGMLVTNMADEDEKMNDEAIAARLAWASAENDFQEILMRSFHAVYLESIGYEQDVEFCLRKDVYDLVPHLKGDTIVRFQAGQRQV